MAVGIRSHTRHLALRARRRIARSFYATLYRDDFPQVSRTAVLAGTARSGTTWLGEVIASRLNCRMMFEPFQCRKVPAFAGFNYFHYARPDEDDPALEAYCERVFSGRIRDAWIDREVRRLRPDLRLVKEIRANLFLGWIAARFPEVPLLFLVRHPCAVVESRLRLRWATDSDIASFLTQPKLVQDHLADKLDVIASVDTDVGKHAVIWCISNLVPLRQLSDGGLTLLFYEDLCRQPEIELNRVFGALGRLIQQPGRRLTRPSSTTTVTSAVLAAGSPPLHAARALDARDTAIVMDIVEAFGLAELYDASGRPRQSS